MKHRVLVIDDDASIRTSLSEALAESGLEVATADGARAALADIDTFRPDLVLSDVRMPGMDGLALLSILRESHPSIDVVLMTAFDDLGTVATAMRGGAVDFLVKPIGLAQLLSVTSRVFEDRAARHAAQRQGGARAAAVQGAPATLIGRDQRMIAIYKLVGQAAATRATVLIRGESGTGKELIARAIHEHSTNSAAPFVPLNCGSLPTTLLESELFGHVRGAFTGAHENRRGRFAAAGRGTIFLDEIGDTTLELQTKLLRVIQDQEFQPVGSDRTERSDARVIAATHQDLESLIGAGKFREDLYYRLRVVEIALPPLRERPADIPLLADHLVRRAAASLDTSPPLLSPEALDRLIGYSWPGNVRELENCLKRAVVVASGGVIRPDHLTLRMPKTGDGGPLASLEEVEREQVVRVLAATEHHKGRAAEILGVSRPRLRRLMEKYGIE